VSHDGGPRQWAYLGHALFTFNGDIKRGDLFGAAGEWEAAVLSPAAALPSWVTIQSSDAGEVFADKNGRTLYVAPADYAATRKVRCDDTCMRKFWKIVPAPADAKAQGDWSVVTDEANNRVWGYRGNVVYVHSRDTKPGDIGGDKWAAGSDGNGCCGGWLPIIRVVGDGEN
jgi:predicted lipoprotein with Yx(FWY)xxD motif